MPGQLLIPRIIHQTWKTNKIPLEWRDLVKSWKSHHPNWEYKLWSNSDAIYFVEKHYPEMVGQYVAFSYDIQRADAFRYMLLHHYGGVYVDMDFECLQNVEPLLLGHKFVIGLEPFDQARSQGLMKLVSNALIACIPQHSFLRETVEHLKSIDPKIVTHTEVLSSTGPIMLQQELERYGGDDVHILRPEVFFPLSNNSKNINLLKRGDPGSGQIKQALIAQDSYGIHYWANSWTHELAGPLDNPYPDGIQGYRFYPGLDSNGYDIVNRGRKINVLSEACNEIANAVAFNTDGFIKNNLRNIVNWNPVPNPNGNEGLYVQVSTAQENIERSLISQRFFRYSLIDQYSRILELCPDYTVGRGAGTCEQKWRVFIQNGKTYLLLFGANEVNAILRDEKPNKFVGLLNGQTRIALEITKGILKENNRTAPRDSELVEVHIKKNLNSDLVKGEKMDYFPIEFYRRTVSAIADQKKLVPAHPDAPVATPFGYHRDNVFPDTLFCKLESPADGKYYWSKKEFGPRLRTVFHETIIYKQLARISDGVVLPVDYSDEYGFIYEFREELFNASEIVHYWDRNEYFGRSEIKEIEGLGETIIDHPRLPTLPLRTLTDFQTIRTSRGLAFIDFTPLKKFLC